MSPCSSRGTPTCNPVSPRGSSTRSRRNARKSSPLTRSMSSASTQCADVGWYSNRVPGSQLQRHAANRASRRVAVVPLDGNERRVREARRVQQHLLDGDDVLAVRSELGNELGDSARHVERALAHQDPYCRPRRRAWSRRRSRSETRAARRRACARRRRCPSRASAIWHEGTRPSSMSLCAWVTSASNALESIPSSAGSSTGRRSKGAFAMVAAG